VILRECAETLNSGKSLAHSLKSGFQKAKGVLSPLVILLAVQPMDLKKQQNCYC
jgi:hypothetical protein